MPLRISWDRLLKPVSADRFDAKYYSQKSLHLKQRISPATGPERLEQ
jgi:hypothetical protein